MNNKEVMQQALEALETYKGFIDDAHIIEGQWHWLDGSDNTITALRTALEQPEQEPVPDALGHVGFQEWWDAVADGYEVNDFKKMRRAWNAALKHEAQPVAERKPLTDERILHFVDTYVGGSSPSYPLDNSDWINFARAIEAAHNIKEGT